MTYDELEVGDVFIPFSEALEPQLVVARPPSRRLFDRDVELLGLLNGRIVKYFSSGLIDHEAIVLRRGANVNVPDSREDEPG